MTRENAGVAVRMPMTATAHSRRRIEERLGLRFPRLVDVVGRAVWRLPRRSRLRRRLVYRFVRVAWEAFNRDDLDAMFMLYHPDVSAIHPPEWGTIGVQTTLHGREERVRYQKELSEDWDSLRFEPHELIELPDNRLVSLGRMRGTGRASGVAVDTEWGAVLTMSDARVVHERIIQSHSKALEAVGLSE